MVVTEIRNIPYFDGHCDTIYECMGKGRSLRENSGHVDLMRGQRYGRRAQFFALFDNVRELPEGTAWTKLCQMHDWFCAQAAENADVMALCRTGAEVDAAAAQHKTAALLSIEGADLIDCDVHKIETVSGWGVRLLNPVWNRANVLSGTNAEEPERGLSAEGRDFIHVLEEHEIYPDVSHLSDAGFWDLVRMAKRPIVASHSNARAVCPHRRNLTDDQFRAIRDLGGTAGLNLYAPFLTQAPRASFDDLRRHLDRFLELDGEGHIALGADLDGCDLLPEGFSGLDDYNRLGDFLKTTGYSDETIQNLFCNSLMKVVKLCIM